MAGKIGNGDEDVQKVEIVEDHRTDKEKEREEEISNWDGEERRKEYYHQHRFRQIMTAWMIAFTVVVFWMYIQNRDRSNEGKQAKEAFCIFKHDLIIRARTTEAFLKENPKGIPGIPVSVLRTSLANQQATINSLKTLKCPEDVGGSGG